MGLAPRFVLVMLIAIGSLGLVWAQTEVDARTLEQAFTERLPRGWSIVELTIEAQENYGTSIEPDVRSRFQASVVLNEDTFIAVSQSESATLLQRMASAGEARTFYGVSTSRRQGPGWQTTFALENDPTAGLGRPSGFFAGRIVVMGTDAEAQYRAEREAQELAAHQAWLGQLARDEETRALAREVELTEAAHAVALEETERQARREADVAAREHEASLAAADRERAARELAIRQQSLAALAEGLHGELRNGLVTRVPPFWAVEAFTLGAFEIAGTLEAPTVTQVVEATIELGDDLYATAGQEGGTVLVDVVEAGGATRALYATVVGRWNGTFWLTEWTFESLDGLRSGLPLDQFPAQVIVVGSAEEAAWRAGLDEEHARRAARLAELDRVLDSGSVSDKEAAIARALDSGDDVEANMAMRYILSHTNLLAVRLSLLEANADDADAARYLREAASLGVAIHEFDSQSGAFSGELLSNLSFGTNAGRGFRGQLAGTSVSMTTATGAATLTLDLAAPGRLEGTFDYGFGNRRNPTLRAAVEIQ